MFGGTCGDFVDVDVTRGCSICPLAASATEALVPLELPSTKPLAHLTIRRTASAFLYNISLDVNDDCLTEASPSPLMTASPSDSRDTAIAGVSSKCSDHLVFLLCFHGDTAMPATLDADMSVQAKAESNTEFSIASEKLRGIGG